ncbi:flagellin [Kordiimonas sp. SCSIO 12603]|uniref:flagellin n=1 Tax=Kordiimonas sp. SCSIO 12603 TaxID=2829596 RepID=UPI0021080D06|nr:flagellin [Kordiimonas sp. SCSIO 12603]UTW57633.1 flagellin [Kordiimonas sp. SCSIO 12603]
MAFSVNTNASALSALQNLNGTNARLSTIQTQINTGLNVSSAKDNSAVYAIAQSLRAENAGLSAASASIDRALSTIDVAIAAGEAVSDLLIELKEKAVAAKDAGLDTASRASLNNDFIQLRDQITSIVNNAEFNGTNAVENNGDPIIAITNDDGSSQISVAPQNLSLSGSNVALTVAQEINTAALASAAVDNIESSIQNVNSVLSNLGSNANRLELQKNFVSQLSDTIEIGIGNLVDADLAESSAELQSLQVQQQLGLQALSIANQAPQSVLSLFQ